MAASNIPTEWQNSAPPVESEAMAPVSVETAAGSPMEEQIESTTPLDKPLMASVRTTEEQVSRISAAVASAKKLLNELRTKVIEYDKMYKASDTASSYLGPPIRKAESAFDELASTVTKLKNKSVEVPTQALNQSLSAANDALVKITDVAKSYDEKLKFSTTLRMAVSVSHGKCNEALAEVSRLASLASVTASAQIRGVNQGIRNSAASLVSSGAGFLFTAAAVLDDQLAIEDKALSVGLGVASSAQKVDDRFNVKDNLISVATKGLGRAQGFDYKVTGGRLAPMVLSTYETGFLVAASGLSFVQTGYEDAKEQRKRKIEASQ